MKNKYLILCLTILLIIPLNLFALTYSSDDKDDICVKRDSNLYSHYNILEKGDFVDVKNITYENINGKSIDFGDNNQFKLNIPANCYIPNNDYTFNPDDLTAGVGQYVDIKENGANKYTATCKSNYSFTSSIADYKCVKNDDGSFYTCPDADSALKVDNIDFSSITYDNSSKKWVYVIKINKNSKNVSSNYRIEAVEYKEDNNIIVDGKKYSGYIDLSGDLETAKEEGKSNFTVHASNDSITVKIVPGKKYRLFFVVDSGSCSGSMVYKYDVFGSTEIPNKWKNNSYCTDFINSTINYNLETLNLAKAMVSPCYSDNVSYAEYGEKSDAQVKSKIENKIADFKSIIANNNVIDSNPSAYQCYFENDGASSNNSINLGSYTSVLKQGTYWGISCTETLNLEYDSPVKTNYNGGGFEYNAIVTTNRTCNLFEIDYPKRKERCSYGASCWGGPDDDKDSISTGPNEDFDKCILDCDGGKYTQSCINSCYNKVYVNNKISELNSNIINKSNLLPLYFDNTSSVSTTMLANHKIQGADGNYYTEYGQKIIEDLPFGCDSRMTIEIGAWCTNKETGTRSSLFPLPAGATDCSAFGSKWKNGSSKRSVMNKAYRCTFNYNGSAIQYCQSNYCASGSDPAVCFLVQYSSDNCVEDPEADYQKQVTDYINEYNTFVSYLNSLDSYSNEESFKIQIDETDETISDSKKKDKIEYKTTTFGSGSLDYDYEMKVTRTTSQSSVSETGSYSTVNGLPFKVASSNKTIYLGISKDTYKNKVLNEFNYINKSKSGNEYKDNKFYENAVLKSGYYLQMNSMEVNDTSSWPTSASDNKKVDDYIKNIRLNFYNLGTWKQWGYVDNITNNDKGIEVDCFYGTVSPKMGGNDFVFRVIKLNEVFPNRDPRFNWSSDEDASLDKGTLYEYEKVNPTALVDDIQAKSNSIYDNPSEVDYEFTLTQKQIRAIKNYNKDEKRSGRVYTDYLTEKSSFECSQSGCLSRFVSDSTYVTWKNGNRASISKCNNAKEYGTKCDDIGS